MRLPRGPPAPPLEISEYREIAMTTWNSDGEAIEAILNASGNENKLSEKEKTSLVYHTKDYYNYLQNVVQHLPTFRLADNQTAAMMAAVLFPVPNRYLVSRPPISAGNEVWWAAIWDIYVRLWGDVSAKMNATPPREQVLAPVAEPTAASPAAGGGLVVFGSALVADGLAAASRTTNALYAELPPDHKARYRALWTYINARYGPGNDALVAGLQQRALIELRTIARPGFLWNLFNLGGETPMETQAARWLRSEKNKATYRIGMK